MSNVFTSEQACTKPVVEIGGNRVEVEPNDPFLTTIKKLAAANGLAKFTVKADGREIKSHNMPSTFSGIRSVEVKKYDQAA